jgi:cell division protein FtsB
MTWTNRLIVVLLGGFGLWAFVRWGHYLSADVVAREQEREQLIERNREIRADINRLENEIAALKPREGDEKWNELVDREIARIARDELHMTRPGEVVFEIHGLEASASVNAEAKPR